MGEQHNADAHITQERFLSLSQATLSGQQSIMARNLRPLHGGMPRATRYRRRSGARFGRVVGEKVYRGLADHWSGCRWLAAVWWRHRLAGIERGHLISALVGWKPLPLAMRTPAKLLQGR